MANTGGSVVQLMQQGGWSSSKVAQSYVDSSKGTKLQAAKMILECGDGEAAVPSTSKATHHHTEGPDDPKFVSFNNCSNCTFSINIVNQSK